MTTSIGSGSWRQIPGKLKHVTASGTHSIFGTGPDDTIWRCKKPCVGEWEKIDSGLKQCDATINTLMELTATTTYIIVLSDFRLCVHACAVLNRARFVVVCMHVCICERIQ